MTEDAKVNIVWLLIDELETAIKAVDDVRIFINYYSDTSIELGEVRVLADAETALRETAESMKRMMRKNDYGSFLYAFWDECRKEEDDTN